MGRDYFSGSSYSKIIKEYVEQYGDLLSNNKIAKLILMENPNINSTKDSLRVIIGSARKILDGTLKARIKQECDANGVRVNDAKMLWIKTKESSIRVDNPDYKKEDFNLFKDKLIESLQKHSPEFPKITRKKNNDGHLLVLDPCDIHVGKLATAFETGEDYNSQIAVQRVKEGVQGILNSSSGFSIDKILFVGGNDVLHIDTPKRTTTNGTPQDTDGTWYDNFLLAKQLYVDILEMLLSIADVHFVFNPSNHDYMSGFFLADVIQTHFRLCQNITFDCSISHRKGFRYHNNLIGTTHGNGAKMHDLPLLLAQEFAKDWGETKHRYVYMHHLHHKVSKDFAGVTVEALRSPSGTDSWHHRNGYEHSPKAVEGFIHHKQYGQLARFTHIF